MAGPLAERELAGMACAGALLRPSRRGATSGHRNGRIGYKNRALSFRCWGSPPTNLPGQALQPCVFFLRVVFLRRLFDARRAGNARPERAHAGHSQEEAAARLGVRQSTVSNAENADESNKKTLFRLVDRYTDFEVRGDPHYQIE